ncbi:hypothetical protein [Actinomyces sp. MRS3W]|uniref:hypothetical protein n=1 Tax=Actinomyces sp. MRS3W TaxID=2800796 RepID=UPI0028FD7159|nr:hypothetical protein [Actinomyces sp. MRS3W]MDU0349104.1 hypothetical protein [Actinomyces sp. MRS3W]
MSEKNPADAAPTPEEIEARLAALRASVSNDVEELAQRLAPNTLKALARSTAESTLTDLRGRAQSATAGLKARVSGIVDAPRTTPAAPYSAAAPSAGALPWNERIRRLFDDARDGDPQALAIVTGAAVALAGLSVFALVKAIRR